MPHTSNLELAVQTGQRLEPKRNFTPKYALIFPAYPIHSYPSFHEKRQKRLFGPNLREAASRNPWTSTLRNCGKSNRPYLVTIFDLNLININKPCQVKGPDTKKEHMRNT